MDLQRRFAEGDVDAFEALFRSHQQETYRWIVRVVRDPAAAEDLTIETFCKAWRAAGRFDPERSFGAWLRRIATNVARKYLSQLHPEAVIEDLSRYAAAPVKEDAPNEAILAAFSRLPENLRTVALLALVEEVPYSEIAESMGLSVSAVKTRVFRATRQLRKELDRRGVRP